MNKIIIVLLVGIGFIAIGAIFYFIGAFSSEPTIIIQEEQNDSENPPFDTSDNLDDALEELKVLDSF